MSRLMEDPGVPDLVESPLASIVWPLVMGMAVNLVSLLVASPYQVALIGLVVAVLATLAWANRPMAWMIFVAVSAANPANLGTPIAMNLFSASLFFVLMRNPGFKVLPRLAQAGLFFVFLSMVVSILASLSADLAIPSIHTTDVSRPRPWMVTWTGGATLEVLASQFVTVTNYILGPFLLIPLTFSRIREHHDPELLVKGLIFGLIMPTLAIFLLARSMGHPVQDANAVNEGLLNVSIFRLGQINIQMIRTQVGIILAAFICATFAVAISPVERMTRMAATGCLFTTAYLLLVTGSVGSTLAALTGIMIMLFMSLRHFPVKRYVTLALIGGALAVGSMTVLPQSIQEYATSRYEVRVGKHSSSTGDRSWRWRKAFNYLMDNPSGVGWSIWLEPLGTYPHNDYLTYGIAFGIVSGIVYLMYPSGMLFSFISFALFNRSAKQSARLALALAGAGVAAVVFINSMSDHMTANRWYFNVVWSIIWFSFFASRAAAAPSDSKNP